MARLRSAPSAQPQRPEPQSQTRRQALKEKTNTARRKAPVYEDDGSTEALVKNVRPKRGLRAQKVEQNEDEFVMAGGLGHSGNEEQVAQRSDVTTTTAEVQKSDAAPPTTKANRRPPRMTRKVVQSEAQSKVLEDMKKRMEATARKEAGPKKGHANVETDGAEPSSDALPTKPAAARRSTSSVTERSEFSISPSPPPPGKLSSVGKQRSSLAQPGSALRTQGTPAAESSILALKNFKRRPRQPSMLQMVQQRTASARPSAGHAQASEDPNVFDVEHADDDIDDDEEEFAPEAEGTPLKATKAKQKPSVDAKRRSDRKQAARTVQQSTTVSRKRKSDEADVSPSALEALKAKRQKSVGREQDEAPLPTSQKRPSAIRPSSERQETPYPQLTSDVQVVNSSPSTTPLTEPFSSDRRADIVHPDITVASTEKERDEIQHFPLNDFDDDQEPDVPNGTMAEPKTSSPLPLDSLVATRPTDVMADPLTQVSPSPVKPQKAQKKAKPMSTATLQSLLPKRRQPPKPRHRKSEYDIDSDSEDEDDGSPLDTSHLEEDEDELGGMLRRQTKTARTKTKARRKTKAWQSKTIAAPAARKSSAPAPSKKKKPTKKSLSSKTYGRATTSDKENQNDGDAYESLSESEDSALPNTSLSMHEAARSRELEEAKQKFADVDDWDMEFESVSIEEGRSSSLQWR